MGLACSPPGGCWARLDWVELSERVGHLLAALRGRDEDDDGGRNLAAALRALRRNLYEAAVQPSELSVISLGGLHEQVLAHNVLGLHVGEAGTDLALLEELEEEGGLRRGLETHDRCTLLARRGCVPLCLLLLFQLRLLCLCCTDLTWRKGSALWDRSGSHLALRSGGSGRAPVARLAAVIAVAVTARSSRRHVLEHEVVYEVVAASAAPHPEA